MAKKLKQMREMFEEYNFEAVDKEDFAILKEMRMEMGEISDSRDSAYVRHELGDIILTTLFAVMAGANEWLEIEAFAKAHEKWLRRFLALENGVPSDDTFRLVISSLNLNYVYRIAVRFLLKKLDEIINLSPKPDSEEKEIYSFDGKTSKGSGRKDTNVPGCAPLHTLSAYSANYGVCVGQTFVSEKTNEITSMPQILRMLDLKNSISTWDALNTQKDIVSAVIEGKGDYVGALKGNHQTLHQDVVDYFEPDVLSELAEDPKKYTSTKEKEHSAIVTREYFLEDKIKWLFGREQWAGLKSIGCVRKTIKPNNPDKPPTVEFRFYISSLRDVNDFSRAVREHWGIENGLHWHLDFTFKDDKNTSMAINGAKGLQIFKKLGLAILKMAQCLYPKRTSVKLIRFMLGMKFEHEIVKIFSNLNPDNLIAS